MGWREGRTGEGSPEGREGEGRGVQEFRVIQALIYQYVHDYSQRRSPKTRGTSYNYWSQHRSQNPEQCPIANSVCSSDSAEELSSFNSPGCGYPDFGCIPWNGKIRVGRNSCCSCYTRSHSLPKLVSCLGYCAKHNPTILPGIGG